MKLYELTANDNFKADFYDPNNDELVGSITGTFLGIDGMYCKVRLFGVDEECYYSANLEVEIIK